MPAYYPARLDEFVRTSQSEITAILADQNARASYPLQPEALFAWQTQLPVLQEIARDLMSRVSGAESWSILLEYPIPRIGKRVDAVLLARNVVVVIEVKSGTSPTSAVKQVDDYALSLACFHDGSRNRRILPMVVSNGAVMHRSEKTRFDHLIEPCLISSFEDAARQIEHAVGTTSTVEQIDVREWDESGFRPIPPIIEAAVALYSNMNVFEIGHACAAHKDLVRTTGSIVSEVQNAHSVGRKTICFVTGVPGAGKTLVGLNAVHESAIRNTGSFLSGNGPLVRIVREALIRDVTTRTDRTRTEATLLVQTFVQNVHRFADSFHKNNKVPEQHVIVFDEAQRAWDLAESQRTGRDLSEPEMLLEIMDRHSDWAVIVALVGGGQEINRGEAGLAEWGRALQRFPHWRIVASPEVLPPHATTPEYTLFEDSASSSQLDASADDSLHLRVAVRSIRAQRISDWVDATLRGDLHRAAEIAREMSDRPSLTRSLQTAKLWLNEKRRGSTRAGLVGSASASRLRVDGLEPSFDFHRRFDWENWFLDNDDDVRCSSRLEVFATQFEVQGLELDYVGVCWSEDFVWNGTQWISNRFNNKRWLPRKTDSVSAAMKHRFRVNAYRVLLTRARQGMIIYVPKPPSDDRTRLAIDLERTAEYLCKCGATSVD